MINTLGYIFKKIYVKHFKIENDKDISNAISIFSSILSDILIIILIIILL
jgi:hypothetical protein